MSRSINKHGRHSQSLFLVGRFLKIFCSVTFGQIMQHFIGFPHFILIGQKTWSSWAIPVSDWLKFNKSSPLKLGCTMNCYFVRIMYGRSCTKVPYFVLIIQLIWVPLAILVCNWPIKKRFSMVKLKSSLRKFYSRHHDLVDHYAICVTNDHFLVLYSFMTYHWVCN